MVERPSLGLALRSAPALQEPPQTVAASRSMRIDVDQLSCRRRVRREVADIEHRPQQLRSQQDGLLGHHVRGRMLAALDMIVQQGLHFGNLADRPRWIIDHRPLHPSRRAKTGPRPKVRPARLPPKSRDRKNSPRNVGGRFVRIMAGLNIPSDLARWLAAAAPLEGGTPAHGPSGVHRNVAIEGIAAAPASDRRVGY